MVGGGWAQNTFDALHDRHYRVLWIGSTIAFLAFAMSTVAQSVVAYDITGKNGDVGVVAAGQGLAMLVVSPFGGVFADRVSKRLLLLVGQVIVSATFAAVGALILADQLTIPLLFASTFTMGLMFAFIAPARNAWIGELLHGPRRANGVALQQVGMTSTRIVGPFMAGGLVALPFIGAGGTYIAMGGLIALVVATLWQLPGTRSRGRGEGPSPWRDLRMGMQHVAERPRLAVLTVSFICIVISGWSYTVVLPGYVEDELGHSSADIAWLLGVSGVSGLLVTVGTAGFAQSRHALRLQISGALAMGTALVLLGVAGGFAAALLVMLLVGCGFSLFQMMNNALVMQESDPAYFGRVMSLVMMAWGFNGIAGLPFGLLADSVGERATLVVMGTAVLAFTGAMIVAFQVAGRRSAVLQPAPIPAGESAAR